MSKDKKMNIQAYDGEDAFYSGTDEDYEEFLKSMADDEEEAVNKDAAEPVENTQKISLSETINLQGVIDKFKKKAGDLGQSAKMVKDSVMDALKSKKDDEAPDDNESARDFDGMKEAIAERAREYKTKFNDSEIGKAINEGVKMGEAKIDEYKKGIDAMRNAPDKIEEEVREINENMAALTVKLGDIDDKIAMLETAINDSKRENTDIIKDGIRNINDEITEIRQSITSVSRLNDSVFDLKNTQMNTKNSISNLEMAFSRLKKKCVLGVTVLSILSAVIIALEIIMMLS